MSIWPYVYFQNRVYRAAAFRSVTYRSLSAITLLNITSTLAVLYTILHTANLSCVSHYIVMIEMVEELPGSDIDPWLESVEACIDMSYSIAVDRVRSAIKVDAGVQTFMTFLLLCVMVKVIKLIVLVYNLVVCKWTYNDE